MSELRIEDPLQDLTDLFGHPGWKVLMEELAEAEETIRNNLWHNAQDERQLYEAKGQIKQLRFFINYQATLLASQEENVEPAY